MKRLFSFFILLLIFNIKIYSQIERPFVKGTYLVGGAISCKFEKNVDFKPGISPNLDVEYTTNKLELETNFYLGYFPINNLVLGLKTDLISSNFKTNSSLESEVIWNVRDRNLLIGPFIRYYVYSGLFIEGFTGFGTDYNKTNENQIKSSIYSWNTGLGYNILLNEHIAIEPLIKYNYFKKDVSEINEKDISKYFSISIGLQIFLKKKNAISINK